MDLGTWPSGSAGSFNEPIGESMPHGYKERLDSLSLIATTNFQRSNRWHAKGINSWSLSDWGVALAGECGELCNVIKKMNRQRDGLQQRAVDPIQLRNQLANEIGDTFLYLDLLAQRANLVLADCVRDKFNIVSEREGFPERL